jgi:hypothetical protein
MISHTFNLENTTSHLDQTYKMGLLPLNYLGAVALVICCIVGVNVGVTEKVVSASRPNVVNGDQELRLTKSSDFIESLFILLIKLPTVLIISNIRDSLLENFEETKHAFSSI